MAPIHERMPVILHRADEERWLDPDLHDPAVLTPLLEPYPAAEMGAYAVSTRVNNPSFKDPALLLPLASSLQVAVLRSAWSAAQPGGAEQCAHRAL